MKNCGGNSTGKKRVRFLAYNELSVWSLFHQKHIVIASEECGDIKLLLEIGVPAANIIACDTNALARDAARKFGVTVSPWGDIEMTVNWAIKEYGINRIGSVNVDLCKTVGTMSPVLERIVGKVSEKAVIIATFLRGRDDCHADWQRIAWLNTYLSRQTSKVAKHWNYQSARNGSKGSPMCCIVIEKELDILAGSC